MVCPGENQQCQNTEGSYRCVCADGYKQMEGICVKEQIPGEPQEPGEGSFPYRRRAGKPLTRATADLPFPTPSRGCPGTRTPPPRLAFGGLTLPRVERKSDLASNRSASPSLFPHLSLPSC